MLRLPFNSSISVGGLTGGEDTGLHMLCWFGVGVVGAGWRWILDFDLWCPSPVPKGLRYGRALPKTIMGMFFTMLWPTGECSGAIGVCACAADDADAEHRD